jgi:hypothetical protein
MNKARKEKKRKSLKMATFCKVRIWKVGLMNLWIWKPRRKTNIRMNKINDISHVLFFMLFDMNIAKYITLTFILLNFKFAFLFNIASNQQK